MYICTVTLAEHYSTDEMIDCGNLGRKHRSVREGHNDTLGNIASYEPRVTRQQTRTSGTLRETRKKKRGHSSQNGIV